MKLVTVSGPPSSGKTSVIIHAAKAMRHSGLSVGIVKFDCLTTDDHLLYQREGFPVAVGISGNLCPDHFFVSNIEDCVLWGMQQHMDFLLVESAGLCNRCSPHMKTAKAVCVIDNLMGINTPKKIGPMLKLADIVVITKGDVVSQAEREVFAFRVRQANGQGVILNVNGVTGQGGHEFGVLLLDTPDIGTVTGSQLRFSMPAALCSYCLGETKIGRDFQMGNVRKMNFRS